MDRRCVAREIGEDGGIWSCLNVSGLWSSLGSWPSWSYSKRACDLISRLASIGLFGSPVLACAGKTVAPFLPFSLARWGNWVSSRHVHGPSCFLIFLLFDRAAGFLPPRPREAKAGARRCGQGWPGPAAPLLLPVRDARSRCTPLGMYRWVRVCVSISCGQSRSGTSPCSQQEGPARRAVIPTSQTRGRGRSLLTHGGEREARHVGHFLLFCRDGVCTSSPIR